MSHGYIPNEVHFYNQPERVVKDSDPWWGRKRSHRLETTCIPSFPVSGRAGKDSANRRNAHRWATFILEYNPETRTHDRVPTNPDLKPVVLPNEPKRGYRLVGAESRGEGGRAWKVVTPEGYLVDMREDVFMPILLDRGLPADGLIDAEFQWCMAGSQLRLEEVGSEAHSAYMPEDVRYPKTSGAKPKAKDIKEGGVYQTAGGQRVFVGRVRHDGKLKWAWVTLDYHRGSYQERLDHKWADSRTMTVTTSHGTLAHLGDVTLPDNIRDVKDWWDGTGCPLDFYTRDRESVSWV